ncbi:hypothetical protein HOY82DRAFT_535429 [Tuber indicum]|nr:hypothetical protein HOY82DRAFT_535429 [Tuber indicum]
MSRSLQMPATLIQAAQTSINRTIIPPTLSPPLPPPPSPQPNTTHLAMHCTPQELRQLRSQGLASDLRGDPLAYGGNVRLDATLYGDDGGRTDIETFEKLYGVLPETVEKISCIGNIAALEIHAGVVAANSKTGSDMFYELFLKFVRLLNESGAGYQEGYLDRGHPDLVNGLQAIINSIKTEVTVV